MVIKRIANPARKKIEQNDEILVKHIDYQK